MHESGHKREAGTHGYNVRLPARVSGLWAAEFHLNALTVRGVTSVAMLQRYYGRAMCAKRSDSL